MRELRISFAMDNAAFEDNEPEEVARILGVIAGKVSNGRDGGRVMDSNGNAVGEWSITEG